MGISLSLTYFGIALESLPGEQGDFGLTRSEAERCWVRQYLGRHCEVPRMKMI